MLTIRAKGNIMISLKKTIYLLSPYFSYFIKKKDDKALLFLYLYYNRRATLNKWMGGNPHEDYGGPSLPGF